MSDFKSQICKISGKIQWIKYYNEYKITVSYDIHQNVFKVSRIWLGDMPNVYLPIYDLYRLAGDITQLFILIDEQMEELDIHESDSDTLKMLLSVEEPEDYIEINSSTGELFIGYDFFLMPPTDIGNGIFKQSEWRI